SVHRLRSRRSGARWLRYPGGDSARIPVRTPARRRPRIARGHPDRPDALRRRVGPRGRINRGRMTEGRNLKVRVKSGGRTQASRRWLERQLNDPYVARAKREGFRSRAAYKLAEIAHKYHLLKSGMSVIDLGAAPGGWSQVAASRIGIANGKGRLVAVDLLEMPEIPG